MRKLSGKRQRAWRAAHPDKVADYEARIGGAGSRQFAWRKANPDKVAAQVERAKAKRRRRQLQSLL
jgi:hypothetical protein